MEINPYLIGGIGIPVIFALLGFAIAWGAHGQKIKNNRQDINQLEMKLDKMDEKLDKISNHVARIDGRLNGKNLS